MSATEPYSRLAGVYDEIVVDPCYARWAAYLHELWGADAAEVRTVLDVCCGTGLMAAELVALGYDVVGVDASAAMLARARSLLGPTARLLQQTLPDLTVEGVFDAAISNFDGLNYLSHADLTPSLAAVAGRLRPGGWLAFDLHTDAMMDFTVANPVVDGADHGHTFSIVSAVDVQTRTCDTRIEITRTADGDTFTEHHRQYFFTDAQVRIALTEAGFERIGTTDEYSSQPVDEATLRATWTARRTLA